MQKRTFSTFGEASNFARQYAQEIGATVKLEREGNDWVVFTNERAKSPSQGHHTFWENQSWHQQNNGWRERHSEEQRKIKEQEKKRREIEQKARETEKRLREKRRLYLEERGNYYRSLSEVELKKQWNKGKVINVESDERALLRDIVREVKGIRPHIKFINLQVCPQCLMVGENCTCGR